MGFPLRGLSYVASQLEQFLSGSETEVFEGEGGHEQRMVERGVERAGRARDRPTSYSLLCVAFGLHYLVGSGTCLLYTSPSPRD